MLQLIMHYVLFIDKKMFDIFCTTVDRYVMFINKKHSAYFVLQLIIMSCLSIKNI